MILIQPYAQQLRNGLKNAKQFPYWPQLIALLDEEIIQIGRDDEEQQPLVEDFRTNLPLKEITALLIRCDFFICIDSFLQHLAHHVPKPGVVLWSKSDPLIFGYPENLNLLKDRKYLRKNQFDVWENESYDAEAFMDPRAVVQAIRAWSIPPRLAMVAQQ